MDGDTMRAGAGDATPDAEDISRDHYTAPIIELSMSPGPVTNTALRPWRGSLDDLAELLSAPKPGTKDGAYLVRGPSNGAAVRADEHITRAYVAILDGDKRIDPETGEVFEGAPAPEIVHEALIDAGITHQIYTSHSHRRDFSRWRCVVPVELANHEELRAVVDHLIGELHRRSVMLAPVFENIRWAQPWFLPRLRSPDAPFLFLRHDDGEPLDVAGIVAAYRRDKPSVAPVEHRSPASRSDGPIGRFLADNGDPAAIVARLETHGYVLRSTATVNGEAAYRLIRPGSTSGTPGVIVFQHRDGSKWLVCSHHGADDPLAGPDGRALTHDAFDVFRMLEHGGDERAALAAIRPAGALSEPPPGRFSADEFESLVESGYEPRPEAPAAACDYESFYAVLADHKYLHRPTGALWPASSVDSTLTWRKAKVDGKEIAVRPSSALDRERPVHQLTWWPGKPEIIEGAVITHAGIVRHPGVVAYNLYRPPQLPRRGKVTSPDFWREHIRTIYPDESEAQHIEKWLAHRAQKPGEKINHALVLCGAQGVGKDALLEPLRAAVGAHNVHEIAPSSIVGRFCGWKKSVVLRVSEAHDTSASDRFAIYEASKVLAAAPPEALLVDEKNRQEYYVPNVLGLIFTTNHETSGIYLPPDDRRHFVVTSSKARESFADDYFSTLFGRYDNGGLRAVCEYLLALDLSGFNAKAPPPKTEAWHAIVAANMDPTGQDLAGLLERLNLDAIALPIIHDTTVGTAAFEVYENLMSNRRQIPHRLAECGYIQARNTATKQGFWEWKGKKVAVYARREMSLAEQRKAAADLVKRHG